MMRYLLAISLLLFSAPAFADDANILELKAEIQRLLEQEPLEVIRPVEIVPESVAIPEPVVPFEDVESGADGSAREIPDIRRPPLVIHVWPSGCIHGERAVAAIVPKLRAQNWREGTHYRIVRSYDGPCPNFSWKGRSFGSGWNGWEAWNADLRSAMGKAVALPGTPVRVAVGKPVARAGTTQGRRGQHSHLCSSCGREWWHSSSEASHNSRSHNCPSCGRTQYVIHRWGR